MSTAEAPSSVARSLREELGDAAFVDLVAKHDGASGCSRDFGGTRQAWWCQLRDARAGIAAGEDPIGRRGLVNDNALLRARNSDLEDVYAQLGYVVERATKRFPYIPPKYRTPKAHAGSREELAVYQLSDTQCGMLVRETETGGLEAYNDEVFQERLSRWQERVYVIVEEVLRHEVPIYNGLLILGGDLAEGEAVYKGQPFHIDLLATEQVFTAVCHIGRAIQFLAGMHETLWVETVDGNHGRTEGTLNMDRLVYLFLRELLRQQENVRWCIGTAHHNAFELGPARFKYPTEARPRTCLAIHGDEIQRYNKTPYYGIDTAFCEWMDVLQRHLHTMFIHHHHTAGMGRGGTWFLNGAWPGATDYSLKKMRGSSRPQQWLHTFHQEVGWTSHRAVYLADQTPLQADAEGQITTVMADDVLSVPTAEQAYAEVRRRLADVTEEAA